MCFVAARATDIAWPVPLSAGRSRPHAGIAQLVVRFVLRDHPASIGRWTEPHRHRESG
jgi:hypothetical protein